MNLTAIISPFLVLMCLHLTSAKKMADYEDWTKMCDGVYMFAPVAEKGNRNEGDAYCKSKGGRLAEPMTVDAAKCLLSTYAKLDDAAGDRYLGFWVEENYDGAVITDSDSVWSLVLEKADVWDSHEPNGRVVKSPTSIYYIRTESVVAISQTGKASDVNKELKLNYVCQKV